MAGPGPLRLEPHTDEGLVQLIARHALVELDLSADNADNHDQDGTMKRWLDHLRSPQGGSHRVRLWVDQGGQYWMALRRPDGLVLAGCVQGVVRSMRREVGAGRTYVGTPRETRLAALGAMIRSRAERVRREGSDGEEAAGRSSDPGPTDRG